MGVVVVDVVVGGVVFEGVVLGCGVVSDVAAKVMRSYPESFKSISLSSVKL